MDAALFSWSGLLISVLVVIAILAIVFFIGRSIVRLIQRRAPRQRETTATEGP